MAKKSPQRRVPAKRKPSPVKRKARPDSAWIVFAQTRGQQPPRGTYYVRAGTEQEAKGKVREEYIRGDDLVLMIAGKLTANGLGILQRRFGSNDVLDAESINLFEGD